MGPSRTSQAVAVARAGFARPHSAAGDPDAQRKLCAGMPSPGMAHMLARLEARTIFFDAQVTAAIAAGISQIVVLGAGYDDRALRFRTPGVTFFEVDHPATQADKRARLSAIGVTPPGGSGPSGVRGRPPAGRVPTRVGTGGPVLVGADFRHDDLPSVLPRAGHDPALPSLFLCEGLLVYLDERATVGLLGGAAAAAGAGSVLAASLSIHAEGLDSALVLARANARRRTAADEPWLTIAPVAAQVSLLARAGWLITASADAAELRTGAEDGRSLLVTAVLVTTGPAR